MDPTPPHPRGLGNVPLGSQEEDKFLNIFSPRRSSPSLLLFLPLLSLWKESFRPMSEKWENRKSCLLVTPLNAINLSSHKWHFSLHQIFLGALVVLKTKPCVLPPDHTHPRNVSWAWPLWTSIFLNFPSPKTSVLPMRREMKQWMGRCFVEWVLWGQWWRLLIACGSRHSTPIMLSASDQGGVRRHSDFSPHYNLSSRKVSSLFCCCIYSHPRSIYLISKRVN